MQGKKKKKSTIIQENDIISVLALFTICLAQHLTEFPINIWTTLVSVRTEKCIRLVKGDNEKPQKHEWHVLISLAAIQLPPFLYHYFYNTFTDTGNKHKKIFHTNKTYKMHTYIHTNIHTKFHTEMVKKIKQPLFRFFNKNKT